MPRCRPFKLIDAMILIAAAAIWMSLMHPRWNQFQMVWIGSRKVPSWQSYIGMVEGGLALSLWLLTVAYLVMRLIPPRPVGSDLMRQPGMLLVGLMIALLILLMLFSVVIPLVPWTNVLIALSLGLSWLAVCRRNRSRAELGWIEGIGRSVGVGWIVTTAVSYPLYLLYR